MKKGQRNLRLFLLMIPVAFFWAGAFIAGKIGVREFPPLTLTFFRFLIASVIVVPIMVKFEIKGWKVKLIDLPALCVIGFVGIFGYHALFFTSLKHTTAINASLICATSPMFTSIIASTLVREALGLKRIGAILLAFSGVVLTILNGDMHLLGSLSLNSGDLIMLGAVLCQATYSVLCKLMMPRYSPLIIVSYSFLMGLLTLLPFVILEAPWSILPQTSWLGWSTVIYMAVFASAAAYILQQISIRSFGPAKTMVFVNLVPVFAIFLSTALLGENAGLLTYFSAGIIITGVYLNSYLT